MDAAQLFPNHANAIDETYKTLDKGKFANSSELKKVFNSLDRFKHKKDWWVIDIAGNHLRLIAFINFSGNKFYVKHIVKHADYDRL